ncbi:hypothetical protein VHUM_02634 [Vanrija humicola]|uniref:Uncharacterized protein n=1 Tax=Vanrija humicola TaxID=5417 RepID=A0A7D8Z021_VANHU|nr:hypothetical protein VHUM_02634 [Vanrija humicola]
MARSGARSSGTKVFSSSSQSAGNGAERRKKQQDDPSEAYTFMPALPKRHRTSEQQLGLTYEEKQLHAQGGRRRDGDDSDEDMSARIKKIAMMIAADDAGAVEDDDDEDVDSDEAWDSDGTDEERWGDVFRDLKKGKGKKGKEVVLKPAKPLNVNLDESEAESDPEVERSPRTAFKSAFPDEEEEDEEMDEDDDDEEGEEDEEDEAEEEDDEDDEDDDNSDPELPSDLSDDDEDDDLDGLDSFVDKLASADKKRKADEEETEVVDKGKKRRVLPVVSAPGLSDGGDLALKSKTKVDLASLISSNPALSGASALLPAKGEKKATSVLKGGVLSAPLPTVVQDRLGREAAYEKTKEEGQKWSGLMKRVKEAEHLSFPLQAQDRGGVKSAGELVAAFKPENEHESAVQALLSKANLTDKGVTAAEDAALRGQDLTVEEIAARRAELRHQRELIFRAEAKAKRVSKIKSKTFRKLARKRDAKAAAADADQGISLEDLERLDPEAAEAEVERLERQRALERATLRHGARSGRWARDVGGDGDEFEEKRRAKEEMLSIKQRLQRKIHGKGSDDESSDASDESDDDADLDEDEIKTRAFDQLAALDAKTAAEGEPKKKGLMQMAFMQKAAERELKKVAEAEADLRKDIEMFGAERDDSGSEDEEAEVIKLGEGRMVFSGPAGAAAPAQTSKPKAKAAAAAASPARPRSPSPAAGFLGDVNPWLEGGASSGPSRKRNTISNNAEARAVRGIKKAAKGAEADDDDRVDIDVAPKAAKAKKAAAAKAESDSEDEADELLPISGVKAFAQRSLVAEAFAGDDVVADFAAAKAAQVAADAPKVEDTSLVGWGSWGGKGVKKRKGPTAARFLKTTAGVEEKDRKDAGRANVIISEKKEKKAAAFLPKDLPYPFTSVAQYEASFKNPVGGEWNSRAGFQRQTIPRVVKKPGAIIEPIRKLF